MKGSTSHMPSRNIVREFAEDQYYHIYNRGVEKRIIFLDDQDYSVFIGLLKKYLIGEKMQIGVNRHAFQTLQASVQLLAYCLMPNHFHLLLHQSEPDGVTKLMRRLSTGYVMYFNERYGRVGSLFQSTYKASHINADAYLHHISRYIHLNPAKYKTWPYSSLPYYSGDRKAAWLTTRPILELFDDSTSEYLKFVNNYSDNKHELDVLRWQLANDLEV